MENIERVLAVGVELPKDSIDIEKSMEELKGLVEAANGVVVTEVLQKRQRIDVTYFIGKGKVFEIKNLCDEMDIDTVVFNDELSGAQLRNLESVIDRKIIDRTNLILDIFASRAKTKEGKLQVELAQLKYRLPRLIGFRDYLSREGGGIGTKGPGEQKLELDRRLILKDITKIKKELKELEESRKIKRKKRERSDIPIVSLVGYTNAGKSTLLNKIIEKTENFNEDKKVFVKDMLFATLETSMREAKLRNGQSFLLSDTVGFVDKLPTHLIEAFKGTLEELEYSDLILHVIDGSDNNVDVQIKVTEEIMEDLDVLDKPVITVINKSDKIDNIVYPFLNSKNTIKVSARTGENLDELLDLIEKLLPQKFRKVSMLIPFDRQEIVNYFLSNYDVEKIDYKESGTEFELYINEIDYNKYNEYILK